MAPKVLTPKLCVHKGTGLAYVKLDGKRVYLGRPDAPDVEARYKATLANWLSSGTAKEPEPKPEPVCHVCVVEVLAKYLQYAKTYYRDADGNTARSLDRVKLVIKELRETHGNLPVAEFTPKKLLDLQEYWIGHGEDTRCYKTVNDYVAITKRIFKWGVARELVPLATFQALGTVENLIEGRSRAKDSRKVKPVSDRHIELVEPYLSPQVRALVQLQLATGARSGELLKLRPCDINMADPTCWEVRLESHKTRHHGKTRTIYIGPEGQDVIRPFLQDRALDAFLFSPREANAARKKLTRKTDKGGRRENQKPNPALTQRKMGDHYTKDSYAKAIRRACEKAKIDVWHPHQLRHSAATKLRKHFGVEAAGVILGHSRLNVTERYAEKNAEQAREIARKIG